MNAPIEVLDNSGNILLRTHVYFISPQVDPGTQSILVKGPIESTANLRNMQLLRARITWSTHPGLTIPVVAVSRINGQYFAFIADQQDGKWVAHQAPLELGDITGNDYAVLNGLKPGQQVVVSGGQSLVDGAPIQIQQ